MSDNVSIKDVGPGVAVISTEEVTTLNGTTVAAQQVQRVLTSLRTADGAAVDVPGDGTFGLDVDVTRLPAVALDSATLAALENITVTVANPGTGQATETTLAAVLSGLGGLASQTTAAAILAKLSADPASQTTLAAVLAKLSADPSTAAAQATQATKLDTLHADLAAVLGKIIAAPATEATLAALSSSVAKTDVAATLTDGRQVVPTPGTAVAIRSSLACKWVTVSALLSNTDQVNVGGSGTLATAGGATGTPLSAGSSVTIPVDNASKVFVDARVAGEGVAFTVGA